MQAPPGLVYLASNAPHFILPPSIVYVLIRAAERQCGVHVPLALIVILCFLSWPFSVFVYVQWQDWIISREAALHGAVLPPVVESKQLGGYDLVKKYAEEVQAHIVGYRLWHWVEKYGGTFNFRILFQDRIYTTEPEYIKRILATEFTGYEKGPNFINQFKTVLGAGVFNADGEIWKFHRNMTRPFFTKERVSHFEIFDHHADEALRLMKARLREGHPVDWQDLMSRFTLDSATEYLFGQNVDSLSAPLPYPPTSPLSKSSAALKARSHPANSFSEEFLQAQIISLRRAYFSKAWPLWEFWKNRAAVHIKTVDAFVEPLCRQALQRKAARALEKDIEPGQKTEDSDDDSETLLEHLVKLTDDPQVIRDETVNIMVAGRDSTAITLTMAGYMLAEHPDMFKRLRQEVLATVGTGKPTYDDIRNMKYMRAFINEVLRLYPPVPFNLRYARRATVWPPTTLGGKPFYIPSGIACLYSIYLMQRRKDLWGPDAHRFDPDRFLDERLGKYLAPNPFIFLPFNAGPRICLGKEFAYNEVSFMLIRLLQYVSSMRLVQEVNPQAVPPPGWAESKGSDGSDRVIFKHHLTLYVQGGVWLEMQTQESESRG